MAKRSSMSLLKQRGSLYDTVVEQDQTLEVMLEFMMYVSIRHVTCVPVLTNSGMYSRAAFRHKDPNNMQSSVVDRKSSKCHGAILSAVRRF